MATSARIAWHKLLTEMPSSIRWAGGGWVFFIAENYILSENRMWLIPTLGGDEYYHGLYGTMSTIATGSIVYAYYRLRQERQMQLLSSSSSSALLLKWPWTQVAPLRACVMSWTCLTIGMTMAFQSVPNMQIPLMIVREPSNDVDKDATWKVQVRCPFDFRSHNNNYNKDMMIDLETNTDLSVQGVERITRHAGLWSLGFIGLGQSLLMPSIPYRLWWSGPIWVALIGGAHSDSRYRRNMGGTLAPEYEAVTSHIPFWAMLMGQQGSAPFQHLVKDEMKPLNTMVATGLATIWVMVGRRGVRLIK